MTRRLTFLGLFLATIGFVGSLQRASEADPLLLRLATALGAAAYVFVWVWLFIPIINSLLLFAIRRGMTAIRGGKSRSG